MGHLTDWIRVSAGEPQVYGTQIERWEGYGPTPFEIGAPDGVDARRAELGMSTLAESFDLFRRNRGFPTVGDDTTDGDM